MNLFQMCWAVVTNMPGILLKLQLESCCILLSINSKVIWGGYVNKENICWIYSGSSAVQLQYWTRCISKKNVFLTRLTRWYFFANKSPYEWIIYGKNIVDSKISALWALNMPYPLTLTCMYSHLPSKYPEHFFPSV